MNDTALFTDETDRLQQRLGYRFADAGLLTGALTHSSFRNESVDEITDNERLEFLGDAVISTVIAEAAYFAFPQAREGDLTRLKALVVAEPSLASKARELNLGACLRLGHGAATSDRASDAPGVLADAFEALIGAVYLDGGFQAAAEIIRRMLAGDLASAYREGRHVDSKTALQMITYSTAKVPPVYSLVESSGPAHAPTFNVEVSLPDGSSYRGAGHSKKEAQQAAAAEAVRSIRNRGGDDDVSAPEVQR